MWLCWLFFVFSQSSYQLLICFWLFNFQLPLGLLQISGLWQLINRSSYGLAGYQSVHGLMQRQNTPFCIIRNMTWRIRFVVTAFSTYVSWQDGRIVHCKYIPLSHTTASYPARQRFLALSSRWETRGTSARNRTISYCACANYVSICHAKRHFLSLKLNITSSYFTGTACDNFGAKKLQYVGNSCFFGECVA